MSGLPDRVRSLQPPESWHLVLDRLEMHVYDAGHMLLETHWPECAAVTGEFVSDVTAEPPLHS